MKLKYQFWITAMMVLGVVSGGSVWAKTRGSRIDWATGQVLIVSESVPTAAGLTDDVVASLWLQVRDMPISANYRVSDCFDSFEDFQGSLLRSKIAFNKEVDEAGNPIYAFPFGGRGGLASMIAPPSLSPPLINGPDKIERAPIARPSLEFSSIIFDLSGVRFSPVMAPRIVDESGQPMFEISRADIRDLRKRGMVGFARTIDEAQSDPRSGANPLVVKAISANSSRRGDICLSSRDLVLLQQSKPFGALLKSCRIVLVTN